MNTYPGVIGRKLGMTQVFQDDGTVVPCTVVEARPVVVGKRTQAKDGYDALVVAFGERREKRTKKPQAGFFKKANVAPQRWVREIRTNAEFVAGYDIGQEIPVESVFEVGQMVDVHGITRGRGFTGVMRRHNFKGAVSTHGSHEYKRHGGSVGTNMTPGRVLPGMKMPGHYGSERVTVLNQRVMKIVPEQNLLLIRGGIPGAKNSLVFVRGAVKKRGGKAEAK